MLTKNLSGQYLYFSLISAISGNPVASASGQISGRKSLDGLSGLIVLSGNIIELGGGSYRANLYDFDTNGDYAGYFFSASGCVPVQYSLVTMGGISGRVYIVSGQNVNIFSGQLSGYSVTPLSGQFWPASGVSTVANVASGTLYPASGVNVVASILSGQNVNVFSGQLSGFTIGLLSGTTYPASGVFTVAAVTIASGTLYPASGIYTVASLLSGQNVNIFSGQLSGYSVTPLSGQFWPASGVFTVAAVTIASGTLYPASGIYTVASILSGQNVNVFSGQLSGQVVNLLSGTLWPASGSVYPASGVLDKIAPEAMLKFNYSGMTGEPQRSLLNATRKLINRWDLGTVNSGKITVYKENDSTEAYTQDVTATSGANPITAMNTNE